MPQFEIRVLARIDVVIDGIPCNLPTQEAKVLAVLVAARRPVRRGTLVDALWEPTDRPTADRLSPVISRLRTPLRKGGLDIPQARESHEYRLTGPTAQHLTEAVDAYRFEARVRAARDLLADGKIDEALAGFGEATADWRGAPFGLKDGEWSGRDAVLPDPCRTFRKRLDRYRADLVRHVAQTALRLGRYDLADPVLDRPVAAGHQDSDAVWLLRVLRMLRDEGGTAAERAIDARRARTRHDDLVHRANALLRLHQQGIDVHQSGTEGPGTPRDPGSPAAIIGRDRELAVLAALVARVAERQPATLSIEGVAGVGKTRLLDELADQVAGTRMRLVRVTCAALDDLYPLRVLAMLLWTRARRDLSAESASLSEADRTALEEFVTAAPGAPAGPGQERAPQRLVSILCTLLREAAQGGGLVVALDNADLLTPLAQELLRRVRHGLGPVSVGFVLAGRPGGWWVAPAAPVSGSLPPTSLTPLGAEAVQEWLGELWRRSPTDAEVAEAFRLSGGLPVRLCEVRPTGGALAVLPGPALGRPATGPLPWLAAAAVTATGLEIDPVLVAGMLDLDPEAADGQQAEAVATRTVESDAGVRFRYDVWREEVLADLDRDPGLARHLHRRALDLLTARMRAAPWTDPALPVRIARHAGAAGTGSGLAEEQIAAAYLDAAAAERRGFALEAAVTWAKRGLERRCTLETRFGLLLTLGDAYHDNGAMAQAGAQYQQAYDVARGQPRLRATAAIQLARRWSDPGQVDQHLVHLLEEALDGLAGDPDTVADGLRMQLSAHLAHKSAMAVGPDSGTALPRYGPELARATLARLTPDTAPIVACEVLAECRWGLYDFAPPGELLGLAERLHDASIHAGSAHFTGEALIALAVDDLRLGRTKPANAIAQRHAAHVEQYDRPQARWLQGVLDTLLDLWHGRFDSAERRIHGVSRRAIEQWPSNDAVPADTLRQTWDGQYYWLLRERGRMAELFTSEVAQRVERHGYFPIWQAGMILAGCETGLVEPAVDGLAAMLAETHELRTLPPHGWAVPTLALLAEACGALHASDADRGVVAPAVVRVRELLGPHAGELALAGWPTVLVGPVERALGVLAIAAGAPDAALNHFARAWPLVKDAPPQLARLRYDEARAVLAVGGPAAGANARDLLRKAGSTAEGLGMARLAQQVHALVPPGAPS